MRLLLITILSIAVIQASAVPDWVLRGILKVETRSYYTDEGLVYVDRRIGHHGERGPYQMCYKTWKQIARKGEQFKYLSTDMEYAKTCTIRYLQWLNKHYGHNNWKAVVQMYHRGPNHHSYSYLMAVIAGATND